MLRSNKMQAAAFRLHIVSVFCSICVLAVFGEGVTTPEREVVNPWQVFLQQLRLAADDNENIIAGDEVVRQQEQEPEQENENDNFILKHKLPPIPPLPPLSAVQKPSLVNWQLGQNVGGLTSTVASAQQPCQWSGNTVCTAQYDPVCVTDLRCISIVQNKCYLNKLNCNCQNLHVLHPQFCNNFAQSNFKRCNLKIYIQ